MRDDYQALQNQINELKYYRDHEVKEESSKEMINQRILQINKEQCKIDAEIRKGIYRQHKIGIAIEQRSEND